MAKGTSHRVVRVSEAAARAASNGHPWIYREGLELGEPGEVVVVHSSRGQVVGWGLSDEGPICIRMFDRIVPDKIDLKRCIQERIRRADSWRTRVFGPDTNAYRLINGPGDDLPGLVVDRYADVAVVRLYSKAWLPYLDWVIEVLTTFSWVGSVFRRYGVDRVDGRQGGEVLAGGDVPEVLVVSEHEMKLIVRPFDGQKTGLFLDQRTHRKLVKEWSPGRLVANLFAYNGGFSVSAALGGAASVCTVDVAADAVEDAQENFRLNGLDPKHYEFVVADVFKWTPSTQLDFLILDPPSMAKSHKAEEGAKRGYVKLHRKFAPHVARGGLLATASCTARLTRSDWEDSVRSGLVREGRWVWQWKSGEPLDHPIGLMHGEGEYLKFALLRRL